MEDTGERLIISGFNECSIEHLHRYAFAAQFVKNKNVVDIASGEGYGSNLLSNSANSVIGVDISLEAVNHAKGKYSKDNLIYVHGSASKIPVESNTIDVVTSFETIEHHDKHQEMMNEIKRILKPDGALIISSPDKLYYSDMRKYSNKYHVKELYFKEFQELIKSNFKNSLFLNQKVAYSSLIVPTEIGMFYEFRGDFNKIEMHESIEEPFYNIAIASQNQIDGVFSSSFDGSVVLKEILKGYYSAENYLKSIDDILNSKTYRIGKFFTSPYLKIKRLFNA